MHDEQIPMHDAAATTKPDGRARTGIIRSIAHWLAEDDGMLPDEGRLAPFVGATAWLNSEPLTPEGLRGRVVLVDFWTYTCVNWLRTLPYIRAWASKYEEAGLTVVGVHTPEFGFESDIDNVVAQTRNLGIEYPVAVDSGYRVWGAFENRFWPAVYIADVNGRVRHHHFGEGEYAQTEMVIQRLLLDAGAQALDRDLVSVEPRGLEVAADWQALRSPETYLGYIQSSGFASEGSAPFDLPYEYTTAPSLPLNSWDLSGNWTVARHAAGSNAPGARIAFQFSARDLNLVMGPRARGAAIPFRVTLDGRPVADANGTDVDADGRGIVRDQNTYQLIRQPGPITDRRFEIEFLETGAEVYCFTFG
ncbi:thioredoxin [Agromyces sp. ZXT2-6]|uniref:thioredoxin n=1 Tax=Agromyces sp. ZXT2-6 TaxID=3461153 RepID=UPI004054BB87